MCGGLWSDCTIFQPSSRGSGTALGRCTCYEVLDPIWLEHGCVTNVGRVCVADTKHNIIFKLEGVCSKVANAQTDMWFMGFHAYEDSSCMVWPVERASDPRRPLTHIKFVSVQQPRCLTLTHPDEIISQSFVCRSWAWQKAQGVSPSMRPALRFVLVDEPQPVLEVAAKAGFGHSQATLFMILLSSSI